MDALSNALYKIFDNYLNMKIKNKQNKLISLNVSTPEGLLYIVADSHLDDSFASGEEFIEMLLKLENPHTIVFLGDLFKIWLAPKKYWSKLHQLVLSSLENLRDNGCNVVLIAGNREMLLPRNLNERWKKILPFTHFSNSDWYLKWGNQRYGFIHGDTINYNDTRYLRWKAFTNNRVFETVFLTIPAPLARWIAGRVEEVLSDTNKEYKVFFPEKEIQEFAESSLKVVDKYFIGHFHLDKEIKVEGYSSFLKIVPDWLSQRKVIKINILGEMEVLCFKD